MFLSFFACNPKQDLHGRTPQVRPKSEIYTPKRNDGHPPPPGGKTKAGKDVCFCELTVKQNFKSRKHQSFCFVF